MSCSNSNYRRILVVSLIILFLLIPFALGAAIGRVVPRELIANTYRFDSTRYARVTVSTLLNQHVASISIQNQEENETDSTFAKISMRINWVTQDWGNGFANFYFIEEVVGNRTLAFNNTQASSYMDKIVVEDFDISWFSGRPTFEELSNMTLPEGRFYITIFVDEVDNAQGDNPVRKGQTNSAELKVVSIKDLSITSTPTVENNILKWQLPEVPLYQIIDCKTTSRITIQGPDVQKTITVNHNAPSGDPDTKLKGYPTGTGVGSDGIVTLDLTNQNLTFRAGQTYSVSVELFDWYNASVSRHSTDFTFPAPVGRFTAPTGQIGSFTPTFQWSYGTYAASWISKYDLVLIENDTPRTISNITNAYYTLAEPLKPGTTFTWYTVPYYKSDNTRFFTGQPSTPGTFTTPAHDQMDVQITAPGSETVLFVGDTYDFSTDVTLFNNASLVSAVWNIGGTSYTRDTEDLEYTPQAASGSVAVSCTVTDSLGLSKTSGPINIQVKNPELALAQNIPTQINSGASVTLSLSKANDLDEITWYADGSVIGTGTSIQFTPQSITTYSIQAKAVSNGRSPQGDTIQKTLETETRTLTVIDARKPEVSITFPYTDSETQSSLLVGQSYPLEATYNTYNAFKSIEWKVNNTVVSSNWTPSVAGTYTLVCTVSDVYNNQTSDSRTITAITPLISLTSPADNAVFQLSSPLTASVKAPSQARDIVYKLDDVLVAVNGSYRLRNAGIQTLSVSAAFWIMNPDKSLVKRTEQDSISIKVVDTAPPSVQLSFPSGTRLMLGSPYTLSAQASSENGIASYAWKIGSATQNQQSFSYTPSIRGALQGSVTVQDNEQLSTKVDFNFTVVNPSFSWTSTMPSSVLHSIPTTFSVQTQDIDDQSIQWLVNGDVVGTGKTLSHAFSQPGTATLTVRAKSIHHDDRWNLVTEEHTLEHTLTVYSSEIPQISAATPGQSWDLFSGDTYVFSFESTKPNGQVEESITINGTKFAGNSHSYTIPTGTKTLSVAFEAYDSLSNKKGQQSYTVNVLNPSLSIREPGEGASLPYSESIPLSALAADIPLTTLWWDVDGTKLDGGNLSSFFASKFGPQTLTVHGVAIGNDSEGQEVQKSYSDSISFTVIDATRPRVSLEFPQQGYRLFKGYPYTFSALALSGNTLESLSWRVGSSTFPGQTVRITPTSRFTMQNPMVVSFEATDSYDLSSRVQATVTVLDPILALREIPEGQRIVDTGSSMVFSVSDESRDIDFYSWFINDSELPVASGPSRTYSHIMPNTKSSLKITVKGHTYGYDSDGSYILRLIGQDSRTIEVVDAAPPTLDVQFPYANARLAARESYTFKAASSSVNGPVSIGWSISKDGLLMDTLSGNEVSYQFDQSGTYTISCESTDPYGKKRVIQQPITVHVFAPTIAILNPQETGTVAYGSLMNLRATIENAGQNIAHLGNLSWTIDGKPQSSATVPAGTSGRHTIGVQFTMDVVDSLDTTRTMPIQSSVEGFYTVQKLNPPTVTITAPQPSSVLIVGQAHQFATTISESEAESITWDIGGAIRSGLQTTYTPSSRGKLDVQVSAVGIDGSVGSSSVLVDVIAPSLSVTQPSSGSLQTQENPLVVRLNATDIELSSLGSLQVFVDDALVIASAPKQVGGVDTYEVVLEANSFSVGSHEIRLEMDLSVLDVSGSIKTLRIVSPTSNFLLHSNQLPVVTDNFSDSQTIYMKKGTTIELDLSVTESKNPLQSFSWKVGTGPAQAVLIEGNPVTASTKRSVSMEQAGSVLVTCTVSDIFNRSIASRSVNLTAIDPYIVLDLDGTTTYPFGSTVNLSDFIVANDVMDVSYYLNGTKLDNPYIFLSKAGQNQLHVEATALYPYRGQTEAERVTDSVSIMVREAPKPYIAIQNSLKNQIWAAGDTRNLSVRATADTSVIANNAIASVTWKIGETTLVGEQVSYTVPAGKTERSLPITVTAVDAQGTRQTEEFSVNIINPRFTVLQQSYVTKQGTPIEINSTANRDIQMVRWYVDDVLQSNATAYEFPAMTIGTYAIRAEGVYQTHNDQGSLIQRTISGGPAVSMRVYDGAKPTVSLLFPQNNDTLFAGESYTFSSSASSPNGAVALTWLVDGRTSSGLTRQYYTSRTGEVRIELKGSDQFNNVSTPIVIKTQVVNPSLRITSLQSGDLINIFNRTNFAASVTDISSSSLVWKVNNRPINPDNYTFPSVGNYTVEVSADVQGRLSNGLLATRSYAHSVAVEVFDNTPPSYRIPVDYSIQSLLVGQPASFSVEDVSVVYGPAVVTWTIDGTKYTNSTVTYTADGSKSGVAVSVTVADARGGTSSNSWVIPVKNPVARIASPTGGTIQPYNIPIFFSAGTESKDCDSLSWILNGEVIGTGQDLNLRGIPLGLHTVELRGTSQGLGLNNSTVSKTVNSSRETFLVSNTEGPLLSNFLPSSYFAMLANTSYPIRFSATSPNGIAQTSIKISSEASARDGMSTSFIPLAPGNLNIQFFASDSHIPLIRQLPMDPKLMEYEIGLRRASRRIDGVVYNPSIRITSPANGKVVASNTPLTLLYEAKDLQAVRWEVNGYALESNIFTPTSAGVYNIKAIGTQSTRYTQQSGADSGQRYTFEDAITIVAHSTRPASIRFRGPQTSTALAHTATWIPVEIESDNAIREVNWFIDGRKVSNDPKGLTHTFSAVKSYEVMCEVIDQYEIVARNTMTVRVVSPGLSITGPSSTIGWNNEPVMLAARASGDGNVGYDRSSFAWLLDGAEIAKSSITDGFAHTFDPSEYSGILNFQIVGTYTYINPAGESKTIQLASDTKPYTLKHNKPPTVVLDKDYSAYPWLVGRTYTVSCTAESLNGISNIIWRQNGSVIAEGPSATITASNWGAVELSVQAIDIYGQTSLPIRVPVRFVNPSISIISFRDNQTMLYGDSMELQEFKTVNFDKIEWLSDGQLIEGTTFSGEPKDRPGYLISVRGTLNVYRTDWSVEPLVRGHSLRLIVVDSTPPVVQINYPKATDTLESARTYTFTADASSPSGKRIPDVWWNIQNKRIEGDSIEFTPLISQGEQSMRVEFYARDEYGFETKSEMFVPVVSPFIEIIAPGSGTILATRTPSKIRLQSAGIDPDSLVVLLNGQPTSYPVGTDTIITETGTHTIQVSGISRVSDGNGIVEIPIVSAGREIHVHSSRKPDLVLTNAASEGIPTSQKLIVKAGAVTFRASAVTENPSVQITGTLDDVALRLDSFEVFETKLDGRTAIKVDAVLSAPSVSRGSHVLKLQAIDSIGQRSQPSTWNIAAVKPSVTIVERDMPNLVALNAQLHIPVTALDAPLLSYQLNGVVSGNPATTPAQPGPLLVSVQGSSEVNYPESQVLTHTDEFEVRVYDATPPSVSFPSFSGGIVKLFSDFTYQIEAAYSSVEPVASTAWYLNDRKIGQNVDVFTFKPSHYPFIDTSRGVTLKFEVITEQGVTGSISQEITIVEPSLSIVNPIALPMPLFNSNAPVVLRSTSSALDTIEWLSGFVSGGEKSVMLTGNTGTIRFTQTGLFTIQAVGKILGLSESFQEIERVFESEQITVKVRDRNRPRISTEHAKIRLVAGNSESVPITVEVSTGNAIVSTVWKVGESVYTFNHLKTTLDAVVDSSVMQGKDILQTAISCTVVDEYGMENFVSIPCELVSGRITITSPRQNMRIANDASISLSGVAPYADKLTWALDGNVIESLDAVQIGEPGEHTITMTAQWNHGINQIFEHSVSSAIEVVNSVPPVITVQFPSESHTVLVAGLVYQFRASAVPAGGASIDSIWWMIDGQRYNQSSSSIIFQAPASSYGRRIPVACHVRDDGGLESVVHAEVEVIDPWVALESPSILSSSTGGTVEVSVASREVNLRWLVDGAMSQHTGNRILAGFTTAGFHTIQAVGEAVATAPNGRKQTYRVQSSPVTVQVHDSTPVTIVSSVPATRDIIALAGSEVSCKIFATSPNGLSHVRWTVKDVYNTNVITSQTLPPDAEFVFRASQKRNDIMYVTAEAYDLSPGAHDRRATQNFVVRTISPDIHWISLENGKNYREGTDLGIYFSSSNLTGGGLKINGKAINHGYNISALSPGVHTLEIVGTYVVSDRQGNPVEQSLHRSLTFTVRRVDPPHIEITGITDYDRLIFGEPYTIYADVRSEGTSHTITWYLKQSWDRRIVGYGDELRLIPNYYWGSAELVCEVIDNLGLMTEKSIPIVTILPRLSINTFNGSGNYLPIFAGEHLNLHSTQWDVDSSVWKVNGVPLLENPLWITLEPGEHSITLEGSTYALLPSGRRGNRTLSTTKTVTVYQPLELGVAFEKDHVYVDQDVHAKAQLTGSLETFKLLRWYVNDVLQRVSRDSNDLSLRYAFNEPGYHTIRAELTDSKGVIKTASSRVRVSAPSSIHILRPDMVTAHRDFLAEAIVMQQGRIVGSSATRDIQWRLNGLLQESGTLVPMIRGVAPGPHTLLVSMTDLLGGVSSDRRTFNAIQGFSMSLPKIGEVVQGVPQTVALVLSSIQPEIDLNQVYSDLTWIVDGKEVATGLQFDLATIERPGVYPIQVRYDGVYGTYETPVESVTVRAMQNATILWPRNGDSLESLAYLEASGERFGSYSWTIDGKNAGHGRKISNTLSLTPGSHTASVTVEYLGNVSTTSVAFTIKEPVLQAVQTEQEADQPDAIEIVRPVLSLKQPTNVVYAGPVRFEASLTYPEGVAALSGGSWKWTVSDSTLRQDEKILRGRTGTIDIEIPGEYLVICTYEHPELDGQLMLAQPLIIEPFTNAVIDLGLDRTVYQYGEKLALNVRANDATGRTIGIDEIQWSINGVRVEPDNIVAPNASGEHILQGILLSQGFEIDRATVSFVSNNAPQVRIVEPMTGRILTTKDDFIARCVVADDQVVPESSIVWLLDDEPVATGSSVILGSLESGKQTLRVVATDVHGVSNEQSPTSSVSINAYDPIEISRVLVNHGYEKYLLGSGDSNLWMRVEYEGGLEPAIVWTIRQGSMEIVRSGDVVNLPEHLFSPGSVTVSLLVFDNDSTIMTNSYEVQIMQNTSSEVVSPMPYQSYPWDYQIPVVIRWLGGSVPSISMDLNAVSVPFDIDAKKLDVGYEITCTLSTGYVRYGANALTVNVGGHVSHIPINVTHSDGNITFITTPDVVEVSSSKTLGSVAEAKVTSTASISEIVWTSNMNSDPIGYGTSIDLSECGLPQGEQWITLHATTVHGYKFQQGFATTVLGSIAADIITSPSLEKSRLVVKPGESARATIDGLDRDGGAFTNDQVRWISSQSGFVNEGVNLDLRKISDGAVHEVTAIITSRHSSTAMRKIEVEVKQPEAPKQEPTPLETEEAKEPELEKSENEAPVEQAQPGQKEFSDAQSLDSLMTREAAPVAVVLGIKGRVEIRQNNRNIRLSIGDNLVAGGRLTVPRNAYVEVFYLDKDEQLVVYANRGTYEWDSFSETWK